MRSSSQIAPVPRTDLTPCAPQQVRLDFDLEEIKSRLQNIEERIAKGEKMILAYRENHAGADNFKYKKLLQALVKERDILRAELQFFDQTPISIQENRDKKAQQIYAELVELAFKREFDTPKYLEKEAWVRQYMRDYAMGFELLYTYGADLA